MGDGALPEVFDEAFRYVDEVWCNSSFSAAGISQRAPVPVKAAPLGIAPPRVQLQPVEPFTFRFSFDFLSVMGRKNPLGLITAFVEAFAPNEGPRLIIKSINGDRKRPDYQAVEEAAEGRPDISLMDGYLDETDRDALLASASAYVSLHRSEGFGLTIAEAMVSGIPTIATAYSGNLDFVVPDDPLGVPYDLIAVVLETSRTAQMRLGPSRTLRPLRN